MKYRKAEALFHYAIIITIVALVLATMHTYLRRSIQAKVRDLTDNIISERHLASLNDPVTESMSRAVDTTFNSEERENLGGGRSIDSLSTARTTLVHSVEDLSVVDYGKTVPDVVHPEHPDILYSETDEAQGNSGSDLSGNIGSWDADPNDRGTGGGTMAEYSD